MNWKFKNNNKKIKQEFLVLQSEKQNFIHAVSYNIDFVEKTNTLRFVSSGWIVFTRKSPTHIDGVITMNRLGSSTPQVDFNYHLKIHVTLPMKTITHQITRYATSSRKVRNCGNTVF